MIPVINLLPWREHHRQKQRRYFYNKLAAVLAFVVLVVAMAWVKVDGQHQKQLARNQLLEREISRLDNTLTQFFTQKLKRESLQDRLSLVNALQQQRNNVTGLLLLLPQVTPAGVSLDKVKMEPGKVFLEGRTRTNAELARMLANLEQNPKADAVQIHSIISSEQQRELAATKFKATFRMVGYVVPVLPEQENKDG